MTNKERKADFMVWQLETQVSLMKSTLELYRGRVEYTREDKDALEFGEERAILNERLTRYEIQADYIEATIQELEAIINQYKAEEELEEDEEELEPLSNEDILEWQGYYNK